jgi:osmotically-inducible protein OsmY
VEPAYVIQLVREAFAREEAELGIHVDVVQGAVLLRGTVANDLRRSRLEALARAVCGGPVTNEIRVGPPLAAEAPEALP